MATQASLDQIQNLYIAFYGRPADAAGQTYWADELEAANGDLSAIINAFASSDEYQRNYGELEAAELVNALYQQILGRDAEEAGLDFYVGELAEGNITEGEIALAILNGVQGDDAAVLENRKAVADAFTAAVVAADKAYEGQAAEDAARALLESVGASTNPANVDIAGTVAGFEDAGSEPGEPTEGETFQLTDGREGTGRDVLTGTDGDDTFIGLAGQNSEGAIANAFSTGDFIDGGAGNDKVIASLIHDGEVADGAFQETAPRTENVEEVYLEVLEQGAAFVDAGRMNSVEQYWSDNSAGDLVIEDVRLGDKLSATKDITFGLRDVDTDAGLYASFDTNSLVNEGTSNVNSQLLVRIADVTTATPAAPLSNVEVTVGFTYNGEAILLENIQSADGTYTGMRQAIDAALDAQGLTGLVVTLDNPYNQVTIANNTVDLPFTAQEILVTDPAGNVFSDVTFEYNSIESVNDEFLVAGNAAPVAPGTRGTLIETNVVLDNAGRGSTAGEVVIGGMSNSDEAIEKLNLVVDRNSKVSNVASIVDTEVQGWGDANRVAFEQIEVTSGEAQGNLSIGNIYNTEQFDSTAFTGDELEVTGNVGLNQHALYTYNTSASEDTVTLNIDNSAIDMLDTGVSISTAAGDDTVVLDVTENQSFQTMEVLQNVTINTGAGDDTIEVEGNQRVEISAGAGSDFVYLDSTANGHNATTGIWAISNASGPAVFQDRVLVEASITVTFAGFESRATVATNLADNYVADQKLINDAIKQAIANSPELSKLLTVQDSTSDQQLIITSNVGGENDLAINLFQPEIVASGATAGQVNLPTNQGQTALVQGLIDTTALTSADLATAADIVAEMANLDGNLNADGTAGAALNDFNGGFTAGGSSDATVGLNYSVVDAGSGANDLVVFHSNDNSANVLSITDTFGKVSVVNFHDLSPNDVTAIAEVGFHAIDFTSFLDNQVDPSAVPANNTQSAQNIAITLNTNAQLAGSAVNTGVAAANSVNMLNFDATVADSIDFADLNANNLVQALNGAANAPVVGGLVDATLSPALAGTANLIGNTQKHIVMVENNQNPGEYKVFFLTSTVASNGEVTDQLFDTATAVELGTLDFGNSINFNLVGSAGYADLYNNLLVAADGGEPVDPLDPVDPVDPTVNTIDLEEGTSAPVAATAEDDLVTLDVEAARAMEANTQIEVTGFDVAADTLQLNLDAAAGTTTLADLEGTDGVVVEYNPFDDATLVTFGPDANGDVIALTLAGVADASLVTVEVA